MSMIRYYIQTVFEGCSVWHKIGIGFSSSEDCIKEFIMLCEKFPDNEFRCIREEMFTTVIATTDVKNES